MKALKQAKNSNPSGRWWIKADACDVRKGLKDSMKEEWSGDEGSDGLRNMHKEYQLRCNSVKEFGKTDQTIMDDLRKMKELLLRDLEFLVEGEMKSRRTHKNLNYHLNGKCNAEATLIKLSWDLTGFYRALKTD